MKRFSIFIIVLFLLFLDVRLSFGDAPEFNAASDCDKNCSGNDLWNGEQRLYENSNAYTNLHDGCMYNNWATWCCICEHPEYYRYPSICRQYTLSCPVPTATTIPTLSPIPTLTPIPTFTPVPTHVPIDGGWSAWSTCTKNCGTGIQTHTCTNPAPQYNGKDCEGSDWRYCNTNPCPIDCEWSTTEVETCLKSGGGCAAKKKHSVEAQFGGKECTGIDYVVCYTCRDTNATANTTQNQTYQTESEFYVSTYAVRENSLPGPTITQAQSKNSGFDLFRQPTSIPATIPPTLPPQPTTPQQNQQQQSGDPQIEPSPTMIPTTTPIPTLPPESIIPESLASQQPTIGGGTSFRLDTSKITNVSVAPNSATKNKPILSQEQRLLANNSSPQSSGITVSLQQKTGSQFITQQDELLVKRGNQFFSISNQTTASQQSTKNQTVQNSSQAAGSFPTPQLEINANNVVAYSSMGLSIDPLSGVLTVETPTGPQKVSIMPDEALGIIIELKALSTGGTEPSILLVSEKGSLIYRITGQKVEKFLGLLPISVQKEVLVSADTGSVIRIELDLLSRILSFFTF